MEIVDLNGLSIVFNDPHDIAAILEVVVMDVYNIRKLRRGDTVLDLGAGIGEFSILASRRIGNSGLVISVEPGPLDFDVLEKNISNNECKNIVSFNNAFSPSEREISLEFKGHFFTAKTISSSEIKRCLLENGRNRIDVIKMDIEGGEVSAIRDLKDYLHLVRAIMIELHGTKKEVDEMLEPLGFRFRRLKRYQYIISTLFFSLRHPIYSMNLWKILNSMEKGRYVKKIFKGLEITNSKELMVGVYER